MPQQTLNDYINCIKNADMMDDMADFADNMRVNVESKPKMGELTQNTLFSAPDNDILTT